MPPQSVRQESGFGPSPLTFLLTTKGSLECYPLVNPLQPEGSTRRKSARPVQYLSAAAAAAAAGMTSVSTDVADEKDKEQVSDEGLGIEGAYVTSSGRKFHVEVVGWN